MGIHNLSDYAEILIAEALRGKRVKDRTNQGHDVVCRRLGRIEVKCRRLPADGRIEQRIAVQPSKRRGFDYLAIVIFDADVSIRGAILLPYRTAWRLATAQKYKRLGFTQCVLISGAIEITSRVRHAALS